MTMNIIFWISTCKRIIWCGRSSYKSMSWQTNCSWWLFNIINRIFCQCLPKNVLVHVRNPNHRVLWFWHNAWTKAKQLAKTVKGMQKIHSIQRTNQLGVIQVRNTSCFCIPFKNDQKCVTSGASEKKDCLNNLFLFIIESRLSHWRLVLCNL